MHTSLKEYVAKKRLPISLINQFKEITTSRQRYLKGKINKAEVDKIMREASTYLRHLTESTQRKARSELEKITIRFRHGKDKIGEIFVFENEIYVVLDIKDKEGTIKRTSLNKEGKIGELKKIDYKEFDEKIKNLIAPESLLLKSSTVDDLKKIFGKEFEIIF